MCCSLAVHWVNPGGNQWVWSSGCGPKTISGYFQGESAKQKGSHRCDLEGNSGCSPAGITSCNLEGNRGCGLG